MFDKLKGKDKVENHDDNPYSKDRDQSRYIFLSWLLSAGTIIGFFVLEFFHPVDSPVFFTSEINHIVVQGVVLFWSTLGGYVFGKQQGANDALMKMAGNGGNGTNTTNTTRKRTGAKQ